jgi:nucleotide-binding universal stress UspA family protein
MSAVLQESSATAAPVRFRHLLVAIDGSSHAGLALAEAIALAQRDHATLTVLSVAPTVRPRAAFAPGVNPTVLQAQIDSEVQTTLRAAVAAVPADVSVTEVFRRGQAADAILAQIREGDYDAVVLGARGLGRMAGMFGSVSQRVMHDAEIAVLVAHAPRPGSPDEGA